MTCYILRVIREMNCSNNYHSKSTRAYGRSQVFLSIARDLIGRNIIMRRTGCCWSKSKGTVLEGSHLLVAVGRQPNTDRLNLRSTSVQTDEHGFIKVNDRLETNIDGVYALGDVKGGPAFTHISYDDFRILRANLLEGGHATTEGRLVPYTVFIDPQLGRIGLTETEARNQGLKISVAKLPMSRVARLEAS
jgi:pyruvate/2-oxoglutarate dehydrogenase complex dihydrolipoamide dehydrogenase (E3) component